MHAEGRAVLHVSTSRLACRGGGGHMDDWDPGIKVSGGVRTTIRAASAAQLNQTIRRKVPSAYRRALQVHPCH